MCEHCSPVIGSWCCVCESYHVDDSADTLEIDLAGAKTGPLPLLRQDCAGSTIPAAPEVCYVRMPIHLRLAFLAVWAAGLALLVGSLSLLWLGW